MKEVFKNKNNLIIIGVTVVVMVVIGIVILKPVFEEDSNSGTSSSSKTTKKITEKGQNFKIVASKSSKMEYQTYSTNYISVKIPKGWKVQEDLSQYSLYVFRAYDPNNEDYQIFINLKTEGFTKSEEAKAYYKSRVSNSPQAILPVLTPATTEQYFKSYEEINSAVKGINNGKSYYPELKNFQKIERLGSSELGGDILRGKYTGTKGNAEGIFTATIKDIGTINLGSLDVGYLIAYNTMFVTAPESEFINYEEILLKCISSFEYKQAFIDGFYKEQKTTYQSLQANRQEYQSVSEGIMDSWNKRQKSYDIQSQKRSDATLGYERVYDTQTGEVYKAYNGFTDDYQGNRYKAISDSQYSDKVVGYIEK